MKKERNMWLDGIMGLAVGDALGVPAEFFSRDWLTEIPVNDMCGYGTHPVPKGTWSDDTSMTWAALDSLREGYAPNIMADKFCEWFFAGKYTPHGSVFDYGNATKGALVRYRSTQNPLDCGMKDEKSNGNGALMRILPVCLYCYSLEKNEKLAAEDSIDIIFEATAITHAHLRSKLASALYYFVCCEILEAYDMKTAVADGLKKGFEFFDKTPEYAEELKNYDRLRDVENFADLPHEQIQSTGYVVHSLEAALWCLLNTNNYADSVLEAVNLGGDTDTIAAIAGGLAGLFYGYDAIPKEWLGVLARCKELEAACTDPTKAKEHSYEYISIMPKRRLRNYTKIKQFLEIRLEKETDINTKTLINYMLQKNERNYAEYLEMLKDE